MKDIWHSRSHLQQRPEYYRRSMRNTRSLARTIGVAAAALVIPLVLGSTVVASSSPMTPRTQQISSAPLRLGIINPNGPSATWELDQIESVLGERASLAVIYKDFAQPAPIAELDAADARGSKTLLTWEPWAAGAGVVQPDFQSSDITAGRYDAYITEWARALASWGKPVMLRYAHEMNGNWYPWADRVNGNTDGDYVRAYRHVHDLFTAAGASNVEWVWNPNVPNAVPMSVVYPGSQYVDVVGLDGYNWGTSQSWSAWQTPDQLFGDGLTQVRALALGKPIVLGEVASAEAGGSKPAWITRLIEYLAAQPDVTGFLWFDMNKEVDWRIDSSPASAAAMASALAARPRS
ncbi:glycoside hydrolase family 26 protein [Rhodococcus sp. BS-15]|uniref:glycoside hydrolase family 26 protein n=1 Tax=Rhodococcus sp. BS-15 TaxID=1304954 RepID=UPI001F248278|nr:glycosyl hydrolase [Rhodococcus sp. BS-15]